jgi:hypothetical protein
MNMEINDILNVIADDDILIQNELEYEEIMDMLFAEYDMKMNACYSYNEGAEEGYRRVT